MRTLCFVVRGDFLSPSYASRIYHGFLELPLMLAFGDVTLRLDGKRNGVLGHFVS
jgi:hypothetical protein